MQINLHIQPSEFKSMTEGEFIREYAKLKYIIASQNKAYNNKINNG